MGAHLVQRIREHRKGLVQLTAHTQPLAALTGEDDTETALDHRPRHHTRTATGGHGLEAGQELVPLPARRPPPGARCDSAARQQRPAHVDGVEARRPAPRARAAGRPARAAPPRSGPTPTREVALDRTSVSAEAVGSATGSLLHDHVGVRAADAERRDAGAARPPSRARATSRASVSSSTAPADQSTCVLGCVDVQGLRQDAVPHRHDHLDDAGDAGGGLGVADVGLHRAEPAAAGRRAGPGRRWRGGPGPRWGRRGWCRCRGASTASTSPGARPALARACADDALLGGAVGGGEAVAGAVLVDGGAAHDGEDLVAVAAGVGQPLQERAGRRPRPSRCRRPPPRTACSGRRRPGRAGG